MKKGVKGGGIRGKGVRERVDVRGREEGGEGRGEGGRGRKEDEEIEGVY